MLKYQLSMNEASVFNALTIDHCQLSISSEGAN